MKIVVDASLPYADEYFGSHGDITKLNGREMTNAALQQADILLVRAVTQVNETLLANTPVKFVGSMTAGTEHIDQAWLDQAGIRWATAAGFNAPPVADYVMSVVALMMQRRVIPKEKLKIAVIGAGHVGQRVIDRLKLIGAEVIVCDPPRSQVDASFHSTLLHEIADVDLITLHVPLTQAVEHATYHMINQAFLTRQKPGCVIINASRGAVVESAALLNDGAHLIWCLDVFEDEPNVDPAVMQRALLKTPHIAGYSVQSRIRGMGMLYEAACQAQVIAPQGSTQVSMPKQKLEFAGQNHHWQDIVLGVFNPAIMTVLLQNKADAAGSVGLVFDELRHSFNYRHEFAFVEAPNLALANEDVRILAHLGFHLN